MPVSFKVNKLWQGLTGKSKSSQVSIVAQRFLQVFQDHGVEVSQIPRLLPQIKIGDLQSREKLLGALTPEMLDQTAKMFGIRLQWLEGADDEICEYWHCYKEPAFLLEHLAAVVNGEDVAMKFPLRVLTSSKKLDFRDGSDQLLAPIIVEKIAEFGEEEIYRYHVYRDHFNWEYGPTRIELKALARTVYKQLHTGIPLFVIGKSELQSILDGKLIPHKYLHGGLLTTPPLEDFALTGEESGTAMEIEELPAVLSYIDEHKLQDFSFERPVVANHPEEPPVVLASPAEQEKPKKPGKRAQAQADIWEPAINAAKTLWASRPPPAIAEVIRHIKMRPDLQASSMTESAIRKRIAEFAPDVIRGKPGRKPNKST